MIRFCDKEVYYIMDEELERRKILSYFLDGNRNEIICVLDVAGKFIGSITYDSFVGRELEDAVLKDYVILDKNIWKKAKKYFKYRKKVFGGGAETSSCFKSK